MVTQRVGKWIAGQCNYLYASQRLLAVRGRRCGAFCPACPCLYISRISAGTGNSAHIYIRVDAGQRGNFSRRGISWPNPYSKCCLNTTAYQKYKAAFRAESLDIESVGDIVSGPLVPY
jgi:hypothetical protein